MRRGRRPGPPQPAPNLDALVANGADEAVARLAVRVGRLRVERQWNHQQLADAAAINHAVVSGLESGKRDLSFSSVDRLRRALGVEWVDLLGPWSPTMETGEDAGG